MPWIFWHNWNLADFSLFPQIVEWPLSLHSTGKKITGPSTGWHSSQDTLNIVTTSLSPQLLLIHFKLLIRYIYVYRTLLNKHLFVVFFIIFFKTFHFSVLHFIFCCNLSPTPPQSTGHCTFKKNKRYWENIEGSESV